jgi:predicted short-subunit dehydrogenase-like oxidoreductase (DUF2520 family)
VIETVRIIGAGRVGSAVSARLHERGVQLCAAEDADVVLLCVPDRAIADVARTVAPGPWVGHVSGATPLAALAPHARRFSVHPLQTFTLERGAEQLDGAWAAVTAEDGDGEALATELARLLGLRPFPLADEHRAVYHAAAAFVSSYLVTLHRAAVRLFAVASAPPEALVPLMQRTIDNAFQMTGPIVRGDRVTLDLHRDAIAREAPELEPLYRCLAEASRP